MSKSVTKLIVSIASTAQRIIHRSIVLMLNTILTINQKYGKVITYSHKLGWGVIQ